MIKISKDSWHYKVQNAFYHPPQHAPAKTLCQYIRRILISALLQTIIIVIIGVVIWLLTIAPIIRPFISTTSGWYMPTIVLLLVIIIDTSIVISLIRQTTSSSNNFWLRERNFLWSITWTLPETPSFLILIGKFIYALYRGVCPLIEYTEEQNVKSKTS